MIYKLIFWYTNIYQKNSFIYFPVGWQLSFWSIKLYNSKSNIVCNHFQQKLKGLLWAKGEMEVKSLFWRRKDVFCVLTFNQQYSVGCKSILPPVNFMMKDLMQLLSLNNWLPHVMEGIFNNGRYYILRIAWLNNFRI